MRRLSVGAARRLDPAKAEAGNEHQHRRDDAHHARSLLALERQRIGIRVHVADCADSSGPGQGRQYLAHLGVLVVCAGPQVVGGHRTAFTGGDHFGFATLIPAGFGRVEPGIPAVDTIITYQTFTEAAEAAAASRIMGGIHFQEDNTSGLALGRLIGRQAWEKALTYFNGTARPGAMTGPLFQLCALGHICGF